MATLADAIEAYLKRLLMAQSGFLEVRRCDLADSFSCAPSQINYVLETRFSTAHGYVVESRRGGGGYIRIRRMVIRPRSQLFAATCELIGRRATETQADEVLQRLRNIGLLQQQRAEEMAHFLHAETSRLRDPWSDYMRAGMLKAMLLMVLDPDGDEGGASDHDM